MSRWLLVADPGGHLAVLDWARTRLPELAEAEPTFVTLDTPDARDRLAGARVRFGVGPTSRSPSALLANVRVARRLLEDVRPDGVLTTGAALGVPFLWAARARGVRAVFLEVVDRVDTPSLSGRLVRPVAEVWVQAPAQRRAYPGARVVGVLAPPTRPLRPRGEHVFVSFGTHPSPFERLVVACEALADVGLRVVVQHGASRPPRGCEAFPFLPHRALLDQLDTAAVVVLHGGTSVLAEARAGGRDPLVVARDPARGEHVDGHQRGTVAPEQLVAAVVQAAAT